ncbi:tetratricopeptide repeat protein [Candidatus Dojkabacteria bacterium]|nr:tetratricopeptide repeat protein [Candidatus Dojkabacteria bacterium]
MRKELLIGAVVLVSCGLLLSACTPSKEVMKKAEGLVADADELVNEHKYADALDKYGEAREVYEGNVDIYIGIADIYLLKNRESDAVDVLKVGSRTARNSSQAYELLGRLQLEEGDTDEAIDNLSQAVKKDEENYSAKYNLALACMEKGEFEEARKQLDIPSDAGDDYARSQLLRSVLMGDRVEDAKKEISKVDDYESESEELLEDIEGYGELLEKIDSLDEEEKTDKYVDVILASGALSLGYEDVTLDLLEKYKDVEKEYWELNLYLGHAYFLDGDNEKSEEYLNRASTLNPVDYVGAWLQARNYKELSEENSMVDSYRRAVEIAPSEIKVEIRTEFAEELLNNGQYSEAEDQYNSLIKEDEENADKYRIMLAESYIDRGLTDKIGDILGGIRQESISDELLARYYYLKAVVEFDGGDKQKAIQWVEESLDLDPYSASVYLLRGQIEFEEGNVSETKEYLEKAIDLDLQGDVSAEALKLLDRI